MNNYRSCSSCRLKRAFWEGEGDYYWIGNPIRFPRDISERARWGLGASRVYYFRVSLHEVGGFYRYFSKEGTFLLSFLVRSPKHTRE